MRLFLKIFAALVAFGAMSAIATPAAAQASRTWVSGVGDDANPCSRTAPCKSFAGAMSKTQAGGEINCLDPGGFGSLTITQSITIICDNTIAGVLAAQGASGIVINAGPEARILLSGLDINGAGSGKYGIRVLAAGAVIIRNMTVYGFAAEGGRAIAVEGAVPVLLQDSMVISNATGLFGPFAFGDSNIVFANNVDYDESTAK